MKVKLDKIVPSENYCYARRRLVGTCDRCFRQNTVEWNASNPPHRADDRPWHGQCDCGTWFVYLICDNHGYYWSLPTEAGEPR